VRRAAQAAGARRQAWSIISRSPEPPESIISLLSSQLLAVTTVMAASSKSSTTSSSGSSAVSLLILVGLFALVYVFFLRPRAQAARRQRDTLMELSAGDEVLTAAGIFGTVLDVQADRVTLETAPGTRITVLRSTIARRITPPDGAERTWDEHDDDEVHDAYHDYKSGHADEDDDEEDAHDHDGDAVADDADDADDADGDEEDDDAAGEYDEDDEDTDQGHTDDDDNEDAAGSHDEDDGDGATADGSAEGQDASTGRRSRRKGRRP